MAKNIKGNGGNGKPNAHYGGNGYRPYDDDPDNRGRGKGDYRYFHGEHVKRGECPMPENFEWVPPDKRQE